MRLAYALMLGATLISTSARAAGPIAFGLGDEAAPPSEIVVRKTESNRVGSRMDTSTLIKTYVAKVEGSAPGDRRVQVQLKDVRIESVTIEDPAVRLSADTEVYLMGALKSVPIVLDYNDKGQLTTIADWDATRQTVLKAVESRAASMEGEKLLHAGTTLSPDAVARLDKQIKEGFVAMISKAEPPTFLEVFYDELGLFLLLTGERMELNATVERPMLVRNPTDGSFTDFSHVLTLRETDLDKTKALLDFRLAGDGVALLKKTIVAKLREAKLGEEEITRHVEDMSIHWDAEGALTVDIKSGRLQKADINSRVQAGDIEFVTASKIDVTPAK